MKNYLSLFILKIYCAAWADLFTDAAFTFRKKYAIIFIDGIFKGHSLRVLDINCLSFVNALVKFIQNLFWTFFSA